MSIKIDENLCKRCGVCETICPKKVFNQKGKIINADDCIKCGNCELICPERAISADETPKINKKTLNKKPSGGKSIKKLSHTKGEMYLLSGNEAVAKAAIDAGCLFFGGYPITPASEIMYGMIKLNDIPGGAFVQMEDEIAAMASIIGASWAGKKSMTATSGPGFSLMQENIGYAVMTETPCVIIDVQRAGPSTGQATRPATGDLMQAIWGSHGDAPKIVLVPSTIEECYTLTIKAFYLAEKYRTPVVVLLDGILAHIKETIKLPSKIKIFDRLYENGTGIFLDPLKNHVSASMPKLGNGDFISVTGTTHKSYGERFSASPVVHQILVDHLSNKIKLAEENELDVKIPNITEEVENIIITCGSVSESVKRGIEIANHKRKTKLITIKHISPFLDEKLKSIPRNLKILVVEMNQGQLIHIVKKIFLEAILLNQNNGTAINPSRIAGYLNNRRW